LVCGSQPFSAGRWFVVRCYRRGGVVFGLILVGGIMECSSIMLQRLVRWLLLLDHLLSFLMFGVFGVRLGMEVS
jgi:hypothetical protein